MCCDICPFYDECQELDKLDENCCSECPDYSDCQGEKFDEEDYDEDLDEF
ncbi:MAG: hypothetical protein ABIK33_00230 [candidate division WOR-3 bacterium]